MAECSLSMGSNVAPPVAHRLHEQRAAHHQGFLVGQQQFLAGLRSGQAGRQTRSTHDGGHDRIHLGVGAHIAQRLLTRQHLHRQTQLAHALGQLLRVRRTHHHRIAGSKRRHCASIRSTCVEP